MNCLKFRTAAAALASALVLPFAWAGPAHADGPTVTGAGSTWSQIAVDQWRADVATQQGLKINFSGVGSSAGRQFYLISQVDFAVSEIPFLPDEAAKLRASGRSWQYLPIVAGGTALMYNLKDTAGRQVRDLRLSPQTLAGIFTGRISTWNDKAITADYGRALPAKPIVPVVRSDGSGTSAQMSAFLANVSPSDWSRFAGEQNIANTATSNYPQFGNSVAQKGSDGVANFIAGGTTGVGSIGYVETGYAVQRNFPVAAVKNVSGRYVLPSAANVATALTKARLNPDRTQDLSGVYRNASSNAYPISSYSYMITPTTGLSPAKGAVLAKFMIYFACAGQQKAAVLGYSPLPANLVKVVFAAVKQLPGAPAVPGLNSRECANPTLSGSLGAGADSTPAGSSPSASSASAANSGGSSGPGSAGGSGTGSVTGGTSGSTVVGGKRAKALSGAPGTAVLADGSAADGGSGNYAALEPTALTVKAGTGGAPSWVALALILLIIIPAVVVAMSRGGWSSARGFFGKGSSSS